MKYILLILLVGMIAGFLQMEIKYLREKYGKGKVKFPWM